MHTKIEEAAVEVVEANAEHYNAKEAVMQNGTNAKLVAAKKRLGQALYELERCVLEDRDETEKARKVRREIAERLDEPGAESPLVKFRRVWVF